MRNTNVYKSSAEELYESVRRRCQVLPPGPNAQQIGCVREDEDNPLGSFNTLSNARYILFYWACLFKIDVKVEATMRNKPLRKDRATARWGKGRRLA